MTETLCQRAVDAALSAGAVHAEARLTHTHRRGMTVRDGALDQRLDASTRTLAVRAVADGGVASVATSSTAAIDVDAIARRAVEDARVDAILRWVPAVAPQRDVAGGWFETPVVRAAPGDAEQLAWLLEVDAALRRSAFIASSAVFVGTEIEEIVFVASDGLLFEQRLARAGAGMSAWAVDGGHRQLRSWPGGGDAGWGAGGWERVATVLTREHATRCADEAVELLSAHPCPDGPMTIVLDADALAHHVARGIGASFVAPRAYGRSAMPDDGAPWSPADVGVLEAGSAHVSWRIDPGQSAGLGARGWDDLGRAVRSHDLITRGTLTGLVGADADAPTGCAIVPPGADTPGLAPLNLTATAGDGTLEALIADIDDGLYLSTHRAGSNGPERAGFAHRVEYARRIRRGQLVELVRDVIYHGDEVPFWRRCARVAGQSEHRATGVWYPPYDPACAPIRTSVVCGPAVFEGVALASAAEAS